MYANYITGAQKSEMIYLIAKMLTLKNSQIHQVELRRQSSPKRFPVLQLQVGGSLFWKEETMPHMKEVKKSVAV